MGGADKETSRYKEQIKVYGGGKGLIELVMKSELPAL